MDVRFVSDIIQENGNIQQELMAVNVKINEQLENVAIIAMYCHLRPPDAIAFPT